MNLRGLIGKKVIQIKPIEEKKIIKNYAALSDEVVKLPNYNFCDNVYFKSIIGRCNDDNWKDVTEVYKRINEIRMNDFKECVIKCGDFFYSEKSHGLRLADCSADCSSGLAGLDYFVNLLYYMSNLKA